MSSFETLILKRVLVLHGRLVVQEVMGCQWEVSKKGAVSETSLTFCGVAGFTKGPNQQ
jgi:hypothetical protein